MHDHGGRGGPARPPRHRWRPSLAALVAVLALALAVAACGGGGGKSDGVASLGGDKATATTSPAGSGDPQQAVLAYAKCMRQQGIDMPDPKLGAGDRVGSLLPAGISADDPKFKAAQQACQQYLPDGGQPPRPNPQAQQQLLAFARCMRQHGINNMPDPKPDGRFDMRGVNSDTPKFEAAQQACQQYQPNAGDKQTPSNGGGR